MSATNACETALLQHYFQNADHANVGDAAGLQNSATAGSLYVSLHTGSPGEAGDQTTNEATFTGYARQAVARSSAGWTVSGGQATNAAAVTFPRATAGSETITHFGVGTDSSGAGNLLWYGALASPLTIVTGRVLSFAATTLDINLD